MIYLDASALLRLLVEERESAALADWLTDREGVALVSSELVRVEVARAVRRLNPLASSSARTLFGQLDLVPVSSAVLDMAGVVGQPEMRSLDAIHLASALSVQPGLTAFVTYDDRLVRAGDEAGLPMTRPSSI